MAAAWPRGRTSPGTLGCPRGLRSRGPAVSSVKHLTLPLQAVTDGRRDAKRSAREIAAGIALDAVAAAVQAGAEAERRHAVQQDYENAMLWQKGAMINAANARHQ